MREAQNSDANREAPTGTAPAAGQASETRSRVVVGWTDVETPSEVLLRALNEAGALAGSDRAYDFVDLDAVDELLDRDRPWTGTGRGLRRISFEVRGHLVTVDREGVVVTPVE